MLEIILLVFLCKKMGDVMRAKDRNPLFMQIFTVLSWFGGELFGAIIGTVITIIIHGEKAARSGPGLMLYLAALVGGAICVSLLFFIAYLIPVKAAPVEEIIYEDSEFSSSDSGFNSL